MDENSFDPRMSLLPTKILPLSPKYRSVLMMHSKISKQTSGIFSQDFPTFHF